MPTKRGCHCGPVTNEALEILTDFLLTIRGILDVGDLDGCDVVGAQPQPRDQGRKNQEDGIHPSGPATSACTRAQHCMQGQIILGPGGLYPHEADVDDVANRSRSYRVLYRHPTCAPKALYWTGRTVKASPPNKSIPDVGINLNRRRSCHPPRLIFRRAVPDIWSTGPVDPATLARVLVGTFFQISFGYP